MASGPLEKMKIRAYPTVLFEQSGSPVSEYEVMFNPSDYQRTYKVNLNKDQAFGVTSLLPKFNFIEPEEYNFTFVIDGTGATGSKRNVPDDVKKFLKTVGFYGEIHATLFLTLNWGTLVLRCILENADIKYDLFDPDGKPLRAKISARFVEVIPDLLRVIINGKSSPDLTHVRTVEEGDTLPLLSQKMYGDSSYYIEIARANNLNSFRKLKPGTKLVFPPLNKTAL